MLKLKGTLTISNTQSMTDKWIEINIRDEDAGVEAVSIRISFEEFAQSFNAL